MGKWRFKDPDLDSRERSYNGSDVSYNAVEYEYPVVASKHNFRQWDTKNYEKFRDMLRKNRVTKKEVSVKSDTSTAEDIENNKEIGNVSSCKKKKKKKLKRDDKTLSENESDLPDKHLKRNKTYSDQLMSADEEVDIKKKSKKKNKKSKGHSDDSSQMLQGYQQVDNTETCFVGNTEVDISKKSRKKKKQKMEIEETIPQQEPVEQQKKLKKRNKFKNETTEDNSSHSEDPIPKKKCKNEIFVELSDVSPPIKKKKNSKKEKSIDIVAQTDILENGCDSDEGKIKRKKSKKSKLDLAVETNEDVAQKDCLNKVKKKKRKNSKLTLNEDKVCLSVTENCLNKETLEPKTEKKKKSRKSLTEETEVFQTEDTLESVKKKKKSKKLKTDEADATDIMQTDDTQESVKKKKKSKKLKTDEADGSESTTIEDSFQSIKSGKKSKKTKSEKHKSADCEEDTSTNVVMGQWSTAKFEGADRKDKFMRLMGGVKAGGSGVTVTSTLSVKFNSAVSGEREQNLNQGLEKQYTDALSILTVKGRGSGFGFQKDPAEGKKFYIDVSKTKSLKFDDE